MFICRGFCHRPGRKSITEAGFFGRERHLWALIKVNDRYPLFRL